MKYHQAKKKKDKWTWQFCLSPACLPSALPLVIYWAHTTGLPIWLISCLGNFNISQIHFQTLESMFPRTVTQRQIHNLKRRQLLKLVLDFFLQLFPPHLLFLILNKWQGSLYKRNGLTETQQQVLILSSTLGERQDSSYYSHNEDEVTEALQRLNDHLRSCPD